MKKDNAFSPKPNFPKTPPPKKKKAVVLPVDVIEHFAATSYEDRNRNMQNANSTEISLCGQLMLIATVLLSATVLILGGDSIQDLNTFTKISLLIGLISTVLSIAAGMLYYFRVTDFYEKWAEAHDKDFNLLSSSEIEDWNETYDQLMKHQSGLDTRNSKSWLRVQITLMAIGAVSYIALVVSFLFS